MAIIDSIIGKILIQIGDGEPQQIGEVKIPIEVSVGGMQGPVMRSAEQQQVIVNVDGQSVKGVSAEVSRALRRGIGAL